MSTISDQQHAANVSATEETGVKCELDGVYVHSIPAYLLRVHPEISREDYEERYPGAPLFSPAIQAQRAKSKTNPEPKKEYIMETATVVPLKSANSSSLPMAHGASSKKAFHEAFNLGTAPEALNAKGEPIMIDVFAPPSEGLRPYVEAIDDEYVFNVPLLKSVMMAFTMNIPLLLWGKHGTGKTTIAEQYCARTGRPSIRIQHTVSTEEAHVLGQYVVRNGNTEFEPGPLAMAMRYGLVYIADEYDFALPSVTSVYQPVLEGKRLIIKEAPADWRVVEPHPNFRFVATGNTNGAGDETGLYQGTQMQNAANYSRFGITMEVNYMPAEQETAIIAAKAKLKETEAKKIVAFGENVRTAFAKNEISMTVSPRELIRAAIIGRALGGKFRDGLNMAFINRLNSIDRHAVDQVAQRLFP